MRKGGTYFKVLTYHHTQAMSAVFNKVDQVAPVLWLPSVVWPPPYHTTRLHKSCVCACTRVHPYPCPMKCSVCLCVQTMAVIQPSWTRWGRVKGVISKAQRRPCLRLIGSCSCQMCTCGTYLVRAWQRGAASFGVPLLSGHPSWSYFWILSFIDLGLVSKSLQFRKLIGIQPMDLKNRWEEIMNNWLWEMNCSSGVHLSLLNGEVTDSYSVLIFFFYFVVCLLVCLIEACTTYMYHWLQYFNSIKMKAYVWGGGVRGLAVLHHLLFCVFQYFTGSILTYKLKRDVKVCCRKLQK